VLFPTYYYASAYDIPYKKLYEEGKRGVLFDLDNTLVEHGAPADDRSVRLIRQLKDTGFKVCFISNNKEPRVKGFNEPMGASYVFKAGKPGKEGYLKGCEQLGILPSEAVFVGDQIFTDIWGANRSGIESYLVKPIAFHEEIQIHFKRIPEFFIVLFFRLIHGKRCFLS
jgi:HAD superfamily phosphatase (TIGR01668 family)